MRGRATRNSLGRHEDALPLDTTSPVLRRRSSIVGSSPSNSPVFIRKAVFSKLLAVKSTTGNSSKHLRRSVESFSPFLGQRNQQVSNGERSNITSACKLFTDVADKAQQVLIRDRKLQAAHASPLCERKNFVTVRKTFDVKKSAPKKRLQAGDMGKENLPQQLLRKSGRTKKVTDRFQQFRESSQLKSKSKAETDAKKDLAGEVIEATVSDGRLCQLNNKTNNGQKVTTVDSIDSISKRKESRNCRGKANKVIDEAVKSVPIHCSSSDANETRHATENIEGECQTNVVSLKPLGNSAKRKKQTVLSTKRVTPEIAVQLKEQNSTKLLPSKSKIPDASKRKSLNAKEKESSENSNTVDRQKVTSVDSIDSISKRKGTRNRKGKENKFTDEAVKSMPIHCSSSDANKTQHATENIEGECQTNVVSLKPLGNSAKRKKQTVLSTKGVTPEIAVQLKEQNSSKLLPSKSKILDASKRKRPNTKEQESVENSNTENDTTNKKKRKVSAQESRSTRNVANKTEKNQSASEAKENAGRLHNLVVGDEKKTSRHRSVVKTGTSEDDLEKRRHVCTSVRKSPRMPAPQKCSPMRFTKLKTIQSTSKGQEDVIDENLVKKKPVWAAVNGTPRAGKRRSVRVNSDVFNFSASPVKDDGNKKRKRQYKPRIRTKATKGKSSMKTILITDPNWENPLASSSSESVRCMTSATNRTGGQSTRSAPEFIFDADFYDEINNDNFEESEGDHGVYERDDGDVFDRFEGGTSSSFIPSQSTVSSAVPMVSASENPTPIVSKHLSKHLGSSTPRVETWPLLDVLKEPVNVKDDIAQCFGFEESDEEEEEESAREDTDTVWSLSPVRQPEQQSYLNLTVTSDVMDSINFSNSQPFRFSWGAMRPGNHSYASASRSASMLVHGRSDIYSVSSALSGASSNSSRYTNSRAVKNSQTKSASLSKSRGKNATAAQVKPPKGIKQAKPSSAKTNNRNSKHDVSILFDEEPVEDVETCSNVAVDVPEKNSLPSDTRPFLSPDPNQPFPHKSFGQRPRKSYDKEALEEARLRFERSYGGGAATTTEAETEEDISVQQEPPKRKKAANRKKVAKKQKKPKDNETMEASQSTDDSTVLEAQPKKKPKTKKKKDNPLEKSVQDWASDLNIHFSEIEDCELVVM